MSKEYKYISAIPKPLLDDFVRNKVVPFVGAGFSKNADIPPGLSMPYWNNLGSNVADEIPDYTFENNALDTLSYYETLYSRPKLIELLMRELHIGKVKSGLTYKAFCELFTNIVCTTNFDFLLEDAYRSLQQPFSVIATEDRLAIAPEGDETRLIKLHGDFNHPDRMVVTEYDYDTYLDRNPILATYISNLLITHTLLLIGYSLDDYDLRNLWQVINSRLGQMSRPAYCITVGASKDKIARYQRRNIKVINLPGESCNYKTILYDFFLELKDYIDNRKEPTSTDEKISGQLLIPSEYNRLCFISCSNSRFFKIKPLIYPILQELGITPLRIDDILMPGDNWMEISKTIIRKSKMAIVDVSDDNQNVQFELGYLLKQKESKNIILIADSNYPRAFSFSLLSGYSFLEYTLDPDNKIDNIEKFPTNLKNRCLGIIGSPSLDGSFKEGHKLFDKRDYSACIISVLAELEQLLQRRYKTNMSLQFILNSKKLSSSTDYKTYHQALKYIHLRNKIVHTNYDAKQQEALDVLEFAKYLHKIAITDTEKNSK